MADKEIVIIQETLLQSIVADVITMITLVGAVAIGKWIGSDALQWIAGVLAVVVILTIKPKYRRVFTSITEAKAYLDTLK